MTPVEVYTAPCLAAPYFLYDCLVIDRPFYFAFLHGNCVDNLDQDTVLTTSCFELDTAGEGAANCAAQLVTLGLHLPPPALVGVMPKEGFLAPKAIANRIKAKGLQKLRWYCQMCNKQCRDENGFKCHTQSESHLRQMSMFSENSTKFMDEFSREFEEGMMEIISRRAVPR